MSGSSFPFFTLAKERGLDYGLVLLIAESFGIPRRRKVFRAPDEWWGIRLDHVEAIRLAVINEKRRRRRV